MVAWEQGGGAGGLVASQGHISATMHHPTKHSVENQFLSTVDFLGASQGICVWGTLQGCLAPSVSLWGFALCPRGNVSSTLSTDESWGCMCQK